MRLIQEGTEEFGRASEHFLIEEVRAWLACEEKFLPLADWRTSTGLEVDLVIGDLDLAVEFKASRTVDERDLKGLRALMEDQKVRRAAIVSLDATIRKLPGDVTVYPWQKFCEKLWAGDLLG
jgi:predicted AAA+ superfamily ATPase